MNKTFLYILKHYMALSAMLCILILANGCKDDDNNENFPVEEGFSQERRIELAIDLSSRIPVGDIACELVIGETPVSIKAAHEVINGKSVIIFDKNLRIGSYILKAILLKREDGNIEERNLGCTMNVSTKSITIPQLSYDDKCGFFGKGTADDPYLIASADGLYNLYAQIDKKEFETKDKYFVQVANIDMLFYFNKGFTPIGSRKAYPFKGNYDGRGFKIQNLAVRMAPQSSEPLVDVKEVAAGLFGYVCGATFRNIVMENVLVSGSYSSGGLIGAVLSYGGEAETPTYIENCRLIDKGDRVSTIYGQNFVGGMVGGIDQNAVLLMRRCENKNVPVSTHEEGMFVGGLIGGGTVGATLVLDSCMNRALIQTPSTQCVGGLVGGIATATISNCINYGTISAPKSLATGGLAGGLGSSTLVAVINEGSVSGYDGTGGIVGSTVLSKEDGSYSDLTVSSAHNYGSVDGSYSSGGIVGEAQVMLTDCYNQGSVSADNFAGGMGGYIPTAIVSGCYNKGKISSPDCAGGLVARSVYYILINSSNLGEVYGSGLTAGILALGGNTGMINFCNNYGTISSNGLCAGIIAEAGDRQQLNNRDIASIIVDGGKTEYSILKALTSEPSSVSGIKAGISTATQILGVMRDVKDLIEVIATPAMAQDISKWGSLYDSDLPARNDALAAQMYKEVNASIPFYTGPLANATNLPSLVYANGVDFTSTLIKANDDVFATNIHNRLSEISDQVAKVEKARKIKMAVGKCVLAVVGMIFTGGAATAVVATCSFALTVIEKNTERMDNSVEISQCSNFGAIKGGSKGYGLVAQLGDHVKMSNCFSAGNASGWGFADKSLKNSDDIKVRRMISIGNKDQEGFSNGETHRGQGLIRLSPKNENKHGGTTADRLSDKSTYTELDSPFDFDNKIWAFLIPAVPVPYNNMYFSFR